MRVKRHDAACAVFQERVVTCGGEYDHLELSSAESYDVTTGKWRAFPHMTSQRRNHGLVAVRSRLFAVGDLGSEVYNGAEGGGWREMIAAPSIFCGALSLGSKIFLFEKKTGRVKTGRVFSYDVDADKWTEEDKSEEFNSKIKDFSCTKLPFY